MLFRSEDTLESDFMAFFRDELGYETVNAMHETFGEGGTLRRADRTEFVLKSRLLSALVALNPGVPMQALTLAIETLTADRSLKGSPVAANQEVYDMLKDGVSVEYQDDDNITQQVLVRVVDWKNPHKNDFLAVQQLWGETALHTRRPDIMLFINGLPLVLIELKAVHRNLKDAYYDNLRDYKDTLPELFWYNAFIILSNGSDARIGTLSASWDYFKPWQRVESEDEERQTAVATMLHGTCDKARLLDIIENFTLFSSVHGSRTKIIAQNHQYLGVNQAIDAVRNRQARAGKLGVFWHTTGSGKSYSMVFLAQKVFRKLSGNWTFLIVTDRTDLDDQIYKNFAGSGAIIGDEETVRAESGDDLKQLLRDDHRYVFTLIQKFHARDGKAYPVLSERDNIIIITDEAHRTQYGTLASNMQRALPNAAYLAFTGTPLIKGDEEKTREVFGEYVSVYDFQQAVMDGATVPLYYENRIPELELVNEQLDDDIYAALDDASLEEEAERALERQFSREYAIITRDDRLERIAQDIVDHYSVRGYVEGGNHSKAMVVCVDRFTAVRMYDKVQRHWKAKIRELQRDIRQTDSDIKAQQRREQVQFMRETEMRVVVSSSQNEVADFRDRGLDILIHRERIKTEDLDTNFKNPDHPFRVVFVCAMWMTGFDVPSCDTIYLDKPMRNHTLMQTIARANRVYQHKQNGLIVDYIGIFRNLEKALAIYAAPEISNQRADDNSPVVPRDEQVADLRQHLQAVVDFCASHEIDVMAIVDAPGLERPELIGQAVEALMVSEDVYLEYFNLVREVDRYMNAIQPHKAIPALNPQRQVLVTIARRIDAELTVYQDDVSDVAGQIDNLLDDSILTARYVIRDEPFTNFYNLSTIDFEALKRRFEQGRKRTTVEKLRGAVQKRLDIMVQQNPTRMSYYERFQELIQSYNAGATGVDTTFSELLSLVESINEEEQRHIQEGLTEEELALYDLLIRPKKTLSAAERTQVKNIVHQLLAKLRSTLQLDWHKFDREKSAVRNTIEIVLDDNWVESFDDDIFSEKVQDVYEHISFAYPGNGKSIYDAA